MEFRDYLYLDKDRINKYYKQIGGIIPDIDKEIVEKNVKFDGNIGIKPIIKANGDHISKFHTEKNRTYDTEDILKLLEVKILDENKNIFFDLSDTDINLDTILKGSIIKFEQRIEVPYEFDEIDFIKSILNSPTTSGEFIKDIVNNNSSEEELFRSLVKDGRQIPVYFNLNESKLYSNIKSENLTIDYEEFENYIGEEITILAKVEKNESSDKIKIYDRYKDLFNINRAMRRHIEGEDGDIYIDGPGKKISIIAMYT